MNKPNRQPPIGRLEIGQSYWVPCVRGNFSGFGLFSIGDWIPVLLPMHQDVDLIGITEKHYHIDFRFVEREVSPRDFSKIIWANMTDSGYELEYRRRKCKREMPLDYPHAAAKWFGKLQEKFKCAKLKNSICPHRGIDLSGCQSIAGTVTCPAHGLTFSTETCDLVRVPERDLYQPEKTK